MKRRKARATFAAYITIKGLGGFQEKFISELITNDIQIYEICQGKDGFTADRKSTRLNSSHAT